MAPESAAPYASSRPSAAKPSPLLTIDPALMRRLEALRLSVRWLRWSQHLGGRYVINRRGSSIEFADYMPYMPGDDIRTIDWNLYARLDRLFVRTYKEEVELGVELMIDATASMALPTAEKFARACQLALCLGHVGLAGHHRVRVTWIRPGPVTPSQWLFRRPQVTRLAESLASSPPAGSVNIGQWMQQAAARLRMRGGQAILISDWMIRPAEWMEALRVLMSRHLELKVIQVISPQELEPARLFRGGVLVDSETGQTHELAYSADELARAVKEHNETLARFCKRNGIPLAQVRIDQPVEDAMLRLLPERGFVRPIH